MLTGTRPNCVILDDEDSAYAKNRVTVLEAAEAACPWIPPARVNIHTDALARTVAARNATMTLLIGAPSTTQPADAEDTGPTT
jgi:hypothetical protein